MDGMAELRRQQAAFNGVRHDLDRQYGWMAVPALAPLGALFALEGGSAIAARLAGQAVKRDPFSFVERDPYLRVGDNWATRAGRLAHKALEDRVSLKPGWKYEPDVPTQSGRLLKPDVGTPMRGQPGLESRRLLELKPSTASGRRAAARAVQTYKQETGLNTRAIFYDPSDFL
jgi:hypothetical protein